VTKKRLKPDKKHIDVGKEAAEEGPEEPLEKRRKLFKEMLAEKEVLTFTSLLI
jgi:hypothetical protein